MSVRTEMLGDRKTRRILVSALEMFTKTFPQSAPSLANGREAKAGIAINQTRGQTSEGIFDGKVKRSFGPRRSVLLEKETFSTTTGGTTTEYRKFLFHSGHAQNLKS